MATKLPDCWQGRHTYGLWRPEKYFPDVEVRECRRCQRKERRKRWTYVAGRVPVQRMNWRTRDE